MTDVIESLYMLLLCHAVGDYVLQNDFLAKTKNDDMWSMVIHCVLYTLPFIFLYGFDYRIIILFITHLDIDTLKSERLEAITYKTDQILHILVLIVLYFIL